MNSDVSIIHTLESYDPATRYLPFGENAKLETKPIYKLIKSKNERKKFRFKNNNSLSVNKI